MGFGDHAAAIYDATEPELRSVSIPTRGRAGRPISSRPLPSTPGPPLVRSAGARRSVRGGNRIERRSLVPPRLGGTRSDSQRRYDAAGNSTSSTNTIVVRPALAFANRLVWVRKGRARLNLRCPGTARCIGQVTLPCGGLRRGRGRPSARQVSESAPTTERSSRLISAGGDWACSTTGPSSRPALPAELSSHAPCPNKRADISSNRAGNPLRAADPRSEVVTASAGGR